MSTLQLLRAELWHRKLNVTLSLFALVAAATLFVAGPTMLDGYFRESEARLAEMRAETNDLLESLQRDTETQLTAMQAQADEDLETLESRTRRIMRDLGFNLRIVHKNTDLGRLYAGFVAFEMPEEYVQRLAESPEITKIVHLVATLKQQVDWEGEGRLLVGFAPEATQSHVEKKPPMGYQIPRGKVYLGAIAAGDHAIGDTVEVLGREFEIAQILPRHGNEEDIAICMHLRDAQELLGKPERISEILALGCKCQTANRVEEITAQLEAVLPEAKVTEMRLQAIAREEQRRLVEKHHAQTIASHAAKRREIVTATNTQRQDIIEREEKHRANILSLLSAITEILTPLVILVCATWVGLLAWSNVRERKAEIGLLRALGKGSASIATLFLGKAALLGTIAGCAGSLLGFFVARHIASGILDVNASSFTPSLAATLGGLLGTPVVAAIASYLPALSAIRQDPAVVLMD